MGTIMSSDESYDISDNRYSAGALRRFQQCYTAGPPDECWLWGHLLDNGYGRFWVDGRTEFAHRIAYELAVGPIPLRLHITYVKTRGCITRACVNPIDIGAVAHAQAAPWTGDHNAA